MLKVVTFSMDIQSGFHTIQVMKEMVHEVKNEKKFLNLERCLKDLTVLCKVTQST